MLTPFYYQEEAITSTIDYLFDTDKNPLLWIPTAGGKSLIQAEIAKRIFDISNEARMLFLTDVTALIGQNKQELMDQWPSADASIYSASYGEKKHKSNLVFCGIQSVYKKANLFSDVSVVFVDEAHRVSLTKNSMYSQFFTELKKSNPYLRIVSLTATPWKLSGPLYGTWLCDDIVYKIEMSTLFKEGFLCPLVTPETSASADTETLKKSSSGEFNEKAMQELMDDDTLIRAAIADAMKYASNRKSGLIFASGVKHAYNIQKILKENGEHSEVIIGDTETDERTDIIDRFKAHKLRWIISVGTLTTGFNAKNADLAIVLRATQSSSLWLQIIGRLLRVHESKTDSMILDYGNNIERFGAVDKIGPPPTKEEKAAAKKKPFKECFNCGKHVKALERYCPFCFVEFGEESSPNHGTQASTEDIMGIEAQIKEVNIDRVTFCKHHSRRSGSKTLRVTYHNGMEAIHDYFDFEGEQWRRSSACNWWRNAVNEEISDHCPKHLDTALTEIKQYGLKPVSKITVDYSKVQETSGGNFFGHKILSHGL